MYGGNVITPLNAIPTGVYVKDYAHRIPDRHQKGRKKKNNQPYAEKKKKTMNE